MLPIQLEAIPHRTIEGLPYQHLHFQILIADGIIAPADLKGLQLPANLDFKQGVVIEGKGPIWLYGYLVHECHPAAWVACYDTRLGGVVVSTHTHVVNVSQVLPIELPPNRFTLR
jgi:CRISPR-associated protein Csx3